MKRRIASVILAALVLPLAPAAFAHDPGPPTILVDGRHTVVYRHYGVPPHWLRTHAPFQRWYHASPRHRMHRLSWMQLYDLYRIEVRHSRPVRHYHHRHCDRYCEHYRERNRERRRHRRGR